MSTVKMLIKLKSKNNIREEINVGNVEEVLIKRIIDRIEANPGGKITFYEYMSSALYEPDLGYYTKDKTKIGKNADFYTSSSVGSVFGQTIANSFIELLPYSTVGDSYSILEIGGGTGRFAKDVLDSINRDFPDIYIRIKYYMLEASPFHQEHQREYLAEHLDTIIWINSLDELENFEGIIFSNELIDSFPVHKVQQIDGKLREVYVIWNENSSSFEEVMDELSDPGLNDYFIEQGIQLREGQIAEVNLAAVDWIGAVNKVLKKGFILTIDYGYPAEELYTTYRNDGTLMCYYRHVANDNPYINVGEQDITSHVNFSVLINKGKELGMETVWFTTQSHFLINNGIFNYLQDVELSKLDEKDIIQDETLKRNRAIRQLITPGEMGETFKILLQQKNVMHNQYRFLKEIWEQYGLGGSF